MIALISTGPGTTTSTADARRRLAAAEAAFWSAHDAMMAAPLGRLLELADARREAVAEVESARWALRVAVAKERRAGVKGVRFG